MKGILFILLSFVLPLIGTIPTIHGNPVGFGQFSSCMYLRSLVLGCTPHCLILASQMLPSFLSFIWEWWEEKHLRSVRPCTVLSFSRNKHHCRLRFCGTLLMWVIQFQKTQKKGMKSHMKRPWRFLGHWTALNFALHKSDLKPLFYIWLKTSMERISCCSALGHSEKWADVSLHSKCHGLIIRLLI